MENALRSRIGKAVAKARRQKKSVKTAIRRVVFEDALRGLCGRENDDGTTTCVKPKNHRGWHDNGVSLTWS